MTIPIVVMNVNHALPAAIRLFTQGGTADIRKVAPRGIPTLEAVYPVATTYECACERVLFHPLRDANPFFHFFESLWILAGREDIASLAFFVKRMADFSDDGKIFHGAYGARLFGDWASDGSTQISNVIAQLKADPDTRRAVAAIWHPQQDSGYGGKDMPCNTMLTFKIREGKLHMTVFCRSNDMTLGAYGANVVQFSTLLEYMAAMLGVPVGTYTQISDSFHVYEADPVWQRLRGADDVLYDAYSTQDKPADWPHVLPRKLVDDASTFDAEVRAFWQYLQPFMKYNGALLEGTEFNSFKNSVFDKVAAPLFNAYVLHKFKQEGNVAVGTKALEAVQRCEASDWRLAATQWLVRRGHA